MRISQTFIVGVQNSLEYWGMLLDEGKGETSSLLHKEKRSIERSIHIGLQIIETEISAAQVLLKIFPLIERWKILSQWLPLFTRATNQIKTGRLQLQLQNRLGQLYRLSYQTKKAIEIHSKVLARISNPYADLVFSARIHFNLCEDFRFVQSFPKARYHASKCLAYLNELDNCDLALKASIYNSLGLICLEQGQYLNAINFAQAAIEIWEKTTQHTECGRTYNTLALAYQQEGKFFHARRYYHLALDKLAQTNSKVEQLRVSVGLSWLEVEQGNYIEAKILLWDAIQEAKVISADASTKGLLYTNLGNTYIRLEDFELANTAFRTSIMYWQKIDNIMMIGNSVGGIGDVLGAEGNYVKAIKKYNKAIHILEKYPNNTWATNCLIEFKNKKIKMEEKRDNLS